MSVQRADTRPRTPRLASTARRASSRAKDRSPANDVASDLSRPQTARRVGARCTDGRPSPHTLSTPRRARRRCGKNTVPGPANIACEPCPPGSVSYAGAASCDRCAVGSFWANHTASSPSGPVHFRCEPCPAGRYGSAVGELRPTCAGPCRPGFYCPVASTSSISALCPPGRYGAGESADRNCTGACPVGYTCAMGTTQLGGASPPRPCRVGTYRSVSGGENPDVDCAVCPPGRFGNMEALNSTLGCHQCPSGAACDRGIALSCSKPQGTMPNASKCSTCAQNSQQRDPSSGPGCASSAGAASSP